MNRKLKVLYEDNHLLAIAKPVNLATMGVQEGETSAVTLVKAYLKEKYQKPGNVYLGVVSRIDRLVSGVLLFARTSKAAARLSEQFREKTTKKIYQAIVPYSKFAQQNQLANQGHLVDWVRKNEREQRMVVVNQSASKAQKAELVIVDSQKLGKCSRLKVELLTGRKHQIRLQLSEHGMPILGDKKYGSQHQFDEGIALHALELTIQHPIKKEPLVIQCPVPKAWKRYTDPT